MRLDCASVEEAIWNYARDGVELTAQELAHIDSCESCKQAFEQVEAGLKALGTLKYSPDAPDCTGVVMSQIVPARPKRFILLAWSAVCLLVIVSLGAVLVSSARHVQKAPVQIVKTHPVIPERAEPKAEPQAPEPTANVAVAPVRVAPASSNNRARHKTPVHIRASRKIAKINSTKKPEVEPKQSEPVAKISEPDTDVSKVTLIWSSPGINETSYEYKEQDRSTGEVITRYTTITPNSIDVRVETSKPAKPTSGMIDNDVVENNIA